MDPRGTGYWPRLGSGYDTYTSVTFSGGRALRYTEHLYPDMSSASALKVVGDELPPDARVVSDPPVPPGHPACAQVVESSRTIRALAGVEVLAELRSSGPGYDPGAVSSITYQPLTTPVPAQPGC
jgi:hypothetical protein